MATVITDYNAKGIVPAATAHKVTGPNGARTVLLQVTGGTIYLRDTGEVDGIAFASTDDAVAIVAGGSVEKDLDRVVNGNPPSFYIQGDAVALARVTFGVR